MSNLDLDPNGIHTESNGKERLMGAVTLVGQKVHNHENEDLGEIREIMVDIESGEIAYAVLSFGGLFGMGEKLFAVPWPALHLDAGNRRITFDISRRKLQKIPGFDKNRWPEQPNPQFLDIRADTSFTRDGRGIADEPLQNWRSRQ